MGNTFADNAKLRKFGPDEYMTALIGNRSLTWIQQQLDSHHPFFAYIAPHAPHMPTTPAPWYMDAPLPTTTAPRTPQYNASGVGKHWVVAEQPPLTPVLEAGIDRIFALRHRALLSVDDIVRDVVAAVDAAGQLNNTYFLYTSDHGYSLGTYRLPVEKFQLLTTSLRVPLLVRGPGIPPNTTSDDLVPNIDIGPTILELAGVTPPGDMDGRSFAGSLLVGDSYVGREVMLVEYGGWGTGFIVRGACNESCGICDAPLSRLLDAPSHTYTGLRIVNASANLLYAEFRPDSHVAVSAASTNFTELYDLAADPWALRNIAPASPGMVAALSAQLWALAGCVAGACR